MYDTQMNRMTARLAFGRDYSSGPEPEMKPCPKGGSADTGPTFAFPKARRNRRRWHR